MWNLFELVSPVLVGAGLVCQVIGDTSSSRQLHSCAVVLLWLKLLEVCEHFESVGPLVSVIVRMVAVLIRFSLLCLIFTVAWSVGLCALLRNTSDPPANATATSDTLASVTEASEWSAEYNSVGLSTFTLFKVPTPTFCSCPCCIWMPL